MTDFKKLKTQKKARVLKRWKRLTHNLIKLRKEQEDLRSVSRLQAKVLKTNNFTSVDEPVETEENKADDKTMIIQDEEQDEEELHHNSTVVKSEFINLKNLQSLHKRFDLISNFKARLLAVIKGRKDRKQYRKTLKAIVCLQTHFRRIIAKRIETQKVDEERYRRLKQIQFIERQQRLTEQRKKRKKAALIIEKYMYKKLVRRKHKLLRERLAKVPKELRIVYFKYMALRSDTDVLVSAFRDYMPNGMLSPSNLLID